MTSKQLISKLGNTFQPELTRQIDQGRSRLKGQSAAVKRASAHRNRALDGTLLPKCSAFPRVAPAMGHDNKWVYPIFLPTVKSGYPASPVLSASVRPYTLPPFWRG